MGALGYPKSREVLGGWVGEIAPGRRKHRGPNPEEDAVPIEKKVKVVAGLEARTGPAAKAAERHGASGAAPYVWRRETMGDDGGGPEGKGGPVGKGLDDLPDDVEQLQDMLREAKVQLRKVQLELDVRQATLEIARKDPGADPDRLTNAEKAAMAAALRAKHGLCELPRRWAWPGAATSMPGTPSSRARPGSTPPPRKPWWKRSSPAAAPTDTGASSPRSTPGPNPRAASASGPCGPSWPRRTWSHAPPRRSADTAHTRAGHPPRPRTCC
jgi:hypothetical protein